MFTKLSRTLFVPYATLLIAWIPGLADGQTRITDVTVFADRARVSRTVNLTLEESIQQISLQRLPGWIDPGSIRVFLEDPEAGEVLSIETATRQNPEADPALAEAEASLNETLKRLQELEDEASSLELRLEFLKKNSLQSIRASELVPSDKKKAMGFQEAANYVQQELASLNQLVRNVAREKAALEATRAEQQKERDLRQALAGQDRLEITILIRSLKKAKTSVVLQYELPGATWEPRHEVRVAGSNQVHLVTVADIRQQTGEDWANATIRLSSKLSKSADPAPGLERALAGDTRSANSIALPDRTQSWLNAVERWEQVLQQQAALDALTNGVATALSHDGISIVEVSKRSRNAFHEINDRHGSAVYRVPKRQQIPSDGVAVRVPFMAIPLTGTPISLAAPQSSHEVQRGLRLTNSARLPILPGAASLFLDGTYSGQTRIGFISSGERFTLFAGLDEELHVARSFDPVLSSLKARRDSSRLKIALKINVTNTAKTPRRIRLAERIPGFGLEGVSVSYVRTTPKASEDVDGVVVWDSELAPGEPASFTLHYQLDYPKDRFSDVGSDPHEAGYVSELQRVKMAVGE